MRDIFKKKVDQLFSSMPNVFGVAGDILLAGSDEQGRDQDKIMEKVLRVCRQANLKFNNNKCHLRCTKIPFFSEIIS